MPAPAKGLVVDGEKNYPFGRGIGTYVQQEKTKKVFTAQTGTGKKEGKRRKATTKGTECGSKRREEEKNNRKGSRRLPRTSIRTSAGTQEAEKEEKEEEEEGEKKKKKKKAFHTLAFLSTQLLDLLPFYHSTSSPPDTRIPSHVLFYTPARALTH